MARAAAPSQAQTLLTRTGAQAAWQATVAGRPWPGGPGLPGSQSPALQTHPLPRAGAGAPGRQSKEQGLLAGGEMETEAPRSGSHLRKCQRFNKRDSVFHRSRLETQSPHEGPVNKQKARGGRACPALAGSRLQGRPWGSPRPAGSPSATNRPTGALTRGAVTGLRRKLSSGTSKTGFSGNRSVAGCTEARGAKPACRAPWFLTGPACPAGRVSRATGQAPCPTGPRAQRGPGPGDGSADPADACGSAVPPVSSPSRSGEARGPRACLPPGRAPPPAGSILPCDHRGRDPGAHRTTQGGGNRGNFTCASFYVTLFFNLKINVLILDY